MILLVNGTRKMIQRATSVDVVWYIDDGSDCSISIWNPRQTNKQTNPLIKWTNVMIDIMLIHSHRFGTL